MKIGLFLQDKTKTSIEIEENFNKALELAKENKLDLLVFPEFTITPYDAELDTLSIDEELDKLSNDEYKLEAFEKIFTRITKVSNCAIMIGKQDKEGVIYQYFLNHNVDEDDTESNYYLKHTYSNNSCFRYEDYIEKLDIDLEEEDFHYFYPISIKDLKIGQIICNDSLLPMFSRMYGIQDVDLIINSTGQDVDYKKWSNYLKVRSIENNCYHLCTMSNANETNKNYILGYDNYGKQLQPIKTIDFNNSNDKFEIFDINPKNITHNYDDYDNYEIDEYINQEESENQNQDLYLDVKSITSEIKNENLKNLEKKADNLYLLSNRQNENIILAYVYEDDILYPEIVLSLLHHESLKGYENKKYIILNEWDELDKEYYERVISNVLKVRATENYCTVILDSKNIVKCIQTTKHRNTQLIKQVSNKFGLDSSRMGGPEVTYGTKYDKYGNLKFHILWREKYEALIDRVCEETLEYEDEVIPEFDVVSDINQVEDNICYFAENLDTDNLFVPLLSRVLHWYYLPEKDYFAPSKFIGYVYPENENRFSYYIKYNTKGMDGRITEPVLNSLNYYRLSSDDEFTNLFIKLDLFLNNFGKAPNSKHVIHVPK